MSVNAVTGEIVTTEFQEMDRLDEDQILAELRGEVLTSYVYSFRQGGKDITGLSWAGVKAVAAKMGAVGIEMLQLFENDAAWVCVVRATGPDGSSRIGATTQGKLMRSGDKMIDDPFVLPKVVSKAQRNAIRALLPETLVLEVIKMAQERPQVRPAQPRPAIVQPPPSAQLPAPAQPVRPAPPTAPDDEQDAYPDDIQVPDILPSGASAFLQAVDAHRAQLSRALYGTPYVLQRVLDSEMDGGFNWAVLKDEGARRVAYRTAMLHVRKSEAQAA